MLSDMSVPGLVLSETRAKVVERFLKIFNLFALHCLNLAKRCGFQRFSERVQFKTKLVDAGVQIRPCDTNGFAQRLNVRIVQRLSVSL